MTVRQFDEAALTELLADECHANDGFWQNVFLPLAEIEGTEFYYAKSETCVDRELFPKIIAEKLLSTPEAEIVVFAANRRCSQLLINKIAASVPAQLIFRHGVENVMLAISAPAPAAEGIDYRRVSAFPRCLKALRGMSAKIVYILQ